MKQVLANLYYLVSKEKKLLLLLAVVSFLSSMLEAVGVGSVLPFVDLLQSREVVMKYNNYLMRWGFEHQTYRQLLISVSGGLVLVILFKNIFVVLTRFVQSMFQNLVRVSLSSTIFANYLLRDYDFFVVSPQGVLLQRLTSLVDQATSVLSMFTTIVIQLITMLFVYSVLLFVSLKLTIITTLLIGALAIIAGLVSRYRAYVTGKEVVKLEGMVYSTAAETVGGMRTVRSFRAEGYMRERFFSQVQRLARIRIINDTIFSIPTPAMETLFVVCLCVFVLISSQGGENLAAMIPLLSMFSVGLIRIMQKVSICYSNAMQLANYLPSVNIAVELMRDAPTSTSSWGKDTPRFSSEIRLQNISFSFAQNPGQLILDDVILQIKHKSFVGIAGPSGSGKSTIVDLLLGLYRPGKGEILVDGRNALESIDLGRWRRSIGLVSQETFLFNATVKENIAFGTSEIDAGRVEKVAKMANAHQFISKLPHGYDSEIGERGLKLSGGERQRLAIARALYYDPEIIILDEATSSLDSQSEKEVMQAIENLAGQKTFLVIAHRLSTISQADWIYVIEAGRIAEEGTHATLLEQLGIYHDLCSKQDLKVESANG